MCVCIGVGVGGCFITYISTVIRHSSGDAKRQQQIYARLLFLQDAEKHDAAMTTLGPTKQIK